MARTIRWLAWLLAASLLLGTLLQIGDRLNVFATPPDLSGASNLADKLLAGLPYKQAIWPVFLAWNGLFAIAFLLLIPLSTLLARGLGSAVGAVRVGTTLLATGGIIGAIGQVAILGAVDATVSIPYCDCTSKEMEVVAKASAQDLIQGAGGWLNDLALILVAVGLLWLARILIARLGRSPLAPLAWVAGAAILLDVLFDRFIVIDTIPDIVAVATFGIILPLWAVGVARGAAVLAEPGAEPA
jgi:hypothetical protein